MGRSVFNKLKRGSIYISILAIYGAIFWLSESEIIGLRFNKSKSLPFTLFFSTKFSNVSHGKYASFRHPNYQARIAKQILGLPGDRIDIFDNQVLINNTPIAIAKSLSPSGKIFTAIEPQIIPEGCVYVHAVHEESFDSRYKEFGLIKLEALEEELWPIF